MSEQQRPDWAAGLTAVGVALLIIGAVFGFLLAPMILGGLILLCVGVATASTRERMREWPKPKRTWEPGDRPWRKRDEG